MSKCKYCGTLVKNDYIFCPNCGNLLSGNISDSEDNFNFSISSKNIQLHNPSEIIQKINQAVGRRSFYLKLFLAFGLFSVVFLCSFLLFSFLFLRGFVGGGGVLGFFTLLIGVFLSLSFSALVLYLIRFMDLYEREPWSLIIFSFLWGAFGSTLFSLIFNDINASIFTYVFGDQIGKILTATLSAPIFEEFFKLLVIPIIIIFFRNQFNSPLDGLVYIFASSLGFKVVEDLLYGSNFTLQSGVVGGFLLMVIGRWLLSFLGHPLMSMYSGFSVGLATITDNFLLKVIYVVLGYFLSVTAHFIWNFTASVLSNVLQVYTCLCFPVYTVFSIIMFVFLYFWALNIDRRIIRESLDSDIISGFLSSEIMDELLDIRLRWRRRNTLPPNLRILYDIFMQELASYALLKKQSNNSLGSEIKNTLNEKYEILSLIKPYIYGGVR